MDAAYRELGGRSGACGCIADQNDRNFDEFDDEFDDEFHNGDNRDDGYNRHDGYNRDDGHNRHDGNDGHAAATLERFTRRQITQVPGSSG